MNYGLTSERVRISQLLAQPDISQSVVIRNSWAAEFSGEDAGINGIYLFGVIIHQFWIVDSNKIVGFNSEVASQSSFGFDEIVDCAAKIRLSKIQVSKCVDTFVRNGLLKASKLDDAEIVSLLKSKSPQHIKGAAKFCFWCKGSTYSLQDHHYPVPRSRGGTDVIRICPNCHYEYHSLSQQKFYRFTDKAIDLALGGLES